MMEQLPKHRKLERLRRITFLRKLKTFVSKINCNIRLAPVSKKRYRMLKTVVAGLPNSARITIKEIYEDKK